jgi:transposase-like protein
MKRVRHSDEQIRRKLREAEAALGGGATVQSVCHQLDVSEATFHRWRKKFAARPPDDGRFGRSGGAKEDVSKRLKELEKENKRLKQLVGQLMLDNALLKDALESKQRR